MGILNPEKRHLRIVRRISKHLRRPYRLGVPAMRRCGVRAADWPAVSGSARCRRGAVTRRAHTLPTLCPQLQITTVSCSDVVSQFGYPVAVSTSPSKRLYTPAVGGSIPSAPTGVIAGQRLAAVPSGWSGKPPLCQECANGVRTVGRITTDEDPAKHGLPVVPLR